MELKNKHVVCSLISQLSQNAGVTIQFSYFLFSFLRKRKAFCLYFAFYFLKEESVQAFWLSASHFSEELLLCFHLKSVWFILTRGRQRFSPLLFFPPFFLPHLFHHRLKKRSQRHCNCGVTQISKLSGSGKPLESQNTGVRKPGSGFVLLDDLIFGSRLYPKCLFLE